LKKKYGQRDKGTTDARISKGAPARKAAQKPGSDAEKFTSKQKNGQDNRRYQPSATSRSPGKTDKPSGKSEPAPFTPGKKAGVERGYQQIKHFYEEPKPVPVKKEPPNKGKKKKEKKPFPTGILVSSVVALALIAVFVFVFRVSQIHVVGNEMYSAEYIRGISGVAMGEHILLCNVEEITANIQSNPYIHVESVTREFPDALRITVKERREAAVLHCLDYDVVIDDTGYVLELSTSKDYSELLQVLGVTATGFQLSEPIGEKNDFQTRTLLDLMACLKSQGLEDEIISIDLSNPLSIDMLTDSGITVHIGQPEDLEEKMEWIVDVLPELHKRGITSGVLDVSARGGAIYSPEQQRPAGANQAPIPEESEPIESENTSQGEDTASDVAQPPDEAEDAEDDSLPAE